MPAPIRPTRNGELWQAKFARNLARDARALEQLRVAGYRVIVVWECETKRGEAEILARLSREFAEETGARERRHADADQQFRMQDCSTEFAQRRRSRDQRRHQKYIVVFGEDRSSCSQSEQITGSYFASGKPDNATSDKTDTGFVAPTFDCARP